MSSLLARFITVSIRKGNATHSIVNAPINEIGNRLTIRWGRSSIWEEPQRRTATITLIMAPRKAYAAADYWLGGDIEVTGMHGTYILGSITSFTVNPMLNGRAAVVFSVQETIYMRGFADKTFTTNASNMKLMLSSLQIQRGRFNLSASGGLPDDFQFDRANSTFEEVKVIDAWKATVNSRPLAQAAFSPDQRRISPTCYRLANSSDTRINIPSSQVHGGNLNFSLDETPTSVIFTTGGTFGEERMIAQQTTGRGYGDAPRTDNSPFRVKNIHFGVNDALDLLRAQKSAPREFTIIDTATVNRPTDPTADLFYPMETTHTVMQITGQGLAEFPEHREFYPIGGELVFTHQRTIHKMYCVYANSPAEGNTWSSRTGTYGSYTEQWNEL